MAYNNHIFKFSLLIFVVIFATTTPLAHAGGIRVNGLRVTGQVCCTPTGNCPGQGLAGTVVRLNCTRFLGRVSTTVGQNTTDVNGFFSITVPRIELLDLGLPILPCVVSVQLPLTGTVCPALSTAAGSLVAAVFDAGTAVLDTRTSIQLGTAGVFSVRT